MGLPLSEREPTRAFWRSHFEVWELGGLTQRDYCEGHGLSLKTFGNWRAQLKREDAVGHKARWGRYPRLRPGDSPMANPMTKARRKKLPVKRALPEVAGSERRRQFSEEAKRRIVGEASRPDGSLSEVVAAMASSCDCCSGGDGRLRMAWGYDGQGLRLGPHLHRPNSSKRLSPRIRFWQRDQQPEYTLTSLPTCPTNQDQLRQPSTPTLKPSKARESGSICGASSAAARKAAAAEPRMGAGDLTRSCNCAARILLLSIAKLCPRAG